MYSLDVYCIRTQEWLLLVSYLTYLVHACNEGWFGSACQFKCHCAGMSSCDILGGCASGRCEPGFFGPACQYADLVYLWRTTTTPTFVYDNNEITCNPDPTATELVVSLRRPFRFSWLRIVARRLVRQVDFQIVLDASEDKCGYERDFYADNFTVDTACDAKPIITNVLIRGPLVIDICSVYISGGQDVSLKQQATQSRTQVNYPASNAVDGNWEGYMPLSFCSSTGPGASSEWTVRFSRPVLAARVVILGSASPENALPAINLFTLSETGIRINTYLNLTCRQSICNVNLAVVEPSIALTIASRTRSNLILCEVQVFGETTCPDGTYGLECNQLCSCPPNEICSLATGACSPGCQGFYGYECNKSCGVSCADNLCWQRSGDCINCNPGYFGRLCVDDCPNGKYGQNCLYSCSQRCLYNKCNKVDGTCINCQAGQKGAFCKELAYADYGIWPYVFSIMACLLMIPICCICLRRAGVQQVIQTPEAARR
ncbi:hypothetical protein BsWGS_16442 [Bradybaena similaris]